MRVILEYRDIYSRFEEQNEILAEDDVDGQEKENKLSDMQAKLASDLKTMGQAAIEGRVTFQEDQNAATHSCWKTKLNDLK